MTTLLDTVPSHGAGTGGGVLERVRALLPEIAERAAEGERARAVPAEIITAMRAAGVFRMGVPKVWGGEELGLWECSEVVREIARADGSAGWTAQVASLAWFFIRGLPKETLEKEIFGDGADVMIRGAVAPKGKATPVEGGYRISGRWPLASGPFTPDWFIAGFLVEGAPPLADGSPDMRIAVVRPEQVSILDTWDAVGLRSTQSHDYVLDDVFVPEHHTGPIVGVNNFPAPLYDLPYSPTGVTHDAVILGALDGALDDLAQLAATKRLAFNPGMLLGQDPVFQEKFAELRLRTLALSGLAEQSTRTVMDRALAGEAPTDLEWFTFKGSTQHIHHEGVRILNEIMTLSGSSGLYSSSTLQRRWRDVRCVSQHVVGNIGAVRKLGAVLSGQS